MLWYKCVVMMNRNMSYDLSQGKLMITCNFVGLFNQAQSHSYS